MADTPQDAETAARERVVLPNGWYFEQVNEAGVLYALRAPSGKGFGLRGNGLPLYKSQAEEFASALRPASSPGEVTEAMVEVFDELLSALEEFQKKWGVSALPNGEFLTEQARAALTAALLSTTQTEAGNGR